METDYSEPQASGFDFDNVFSRAAGLATDFGASYLTLKAQEKIATETASAQARLNQYSAVNPSLGAVNPAAAQRQANQSPVANWLPWGTPVAGTTATNAGAPSNVGKWVAIAVVLAVAVLLWKFLRK